MENVDIPRLSNGVRARADGKGDLWALKHRDLGASYYMNDFDGLIGQLGFVINGQERSFAEYCIGRDKPGMASQKRFAVVACFDRKNSPNALKTHYATLSRAFYCYVCQALGAVQPQPPRFFYVIGHSSPWQVSEVSIDSQEIISTDQLVDGDWMSFWNRFGLNKLRSSLQTWLDNDSLQ